MKKIILILSICSLFGCIPFIQFNPSEPRKRGFEYYDKNFILDSNSNLKINGVYYNTDTNERKQIYELKFFEDGYLTLNRYIVGTINYPTYSSYIKKRNSYRNEKGIDKGYYHVKNDSIFFSTKVFYNYREDFYKGKITGDTIDLKYTIYYKKKYNSYEQRFIFFSVP